VQLRHGEKWFNIQSARGFVDPVNNRGVFFDTTMSLTVDGPEKEVKITAGQTRAVFTTDGVELMVEGSPAASLKVDDQAISMGGDPSGGSLTIAARGTLALRSAKIKVN